MVGATLTIKGMSLQELRTYSALNDALGAPSVDHVSLAGSGAGIDEQRCWGGPLAIDDLAVTTIAHAVGLVAAFGGVRTGRPPAPVAIDPMHAAASFRYESFVEPLGWELPPVWDELFGDYRCADGWIRIHTNYAHHRLAVVSALGLRTDATRPEVERALVRRSAAEAEVAIVAASGVASGQRTRAEWINSDEGSAVAGSPPLWESAPLGAGRPDWQRGGGNRSARTRDAVQSTVAPAFAWPLEGIRVVDLTRVLAGPTATGALAAWGADVTRIDPPGFEEVPAIVPITTHGERCARLDLSAASGKAELRRMLSGADVVVHGYRPGALSALGVNLSGAHRRNLGLVEVSLSAFGPDHPLSGRRGFDSIVQNAVGITDLGAQVAGVDRPTSMPCQALDHAAGWIMAAAVANGLIRRATTGVGGSWSTSLAAVADLLWRSSGVPEIARQPSDAGDPFGVNLVMADLEQWLVNVDTGFGPLRRLAWPGRIDDLAPSLGNTSQDSSSVGDVWRELTGSRYSEGLMDVTTASA